VPAIEIYDTTLRDGAQGEGISFSAKDKVKIALKLDELGFHYIEGGWPGSNPKDMAFFEQIKNYRLKKARVTAFGSTRRPGVSADRDENLQQMMRQAEHQMLLGNHQEAIRLLQHMREKVSKGVIYLTATQKLARLQQGLMAFHQFIGVQLQLLQQVDGFRYQHPARLEIVEKAVSAIKHVLKIMLTTRPKL